MKARLWLLGLIALLAACHAEHPVLAPIAPAKALAQRSELCADFLTSLHGPVCIRPLTPEEQSHRAYSFRLEYDGDRVVQRQRINGRGGLEADEDDCAQYRYVYAGGELTQSTGYTRAGSFCERHLYSEHATRSLSVDAWGRTAYATDRLFTEQRFERDARGLITRSRLFGPDGSPITPGGGAQDARYERDAQGLQVRVCYFDEHGQPSETAFRAHCYSSKHDEFGNETERLSWDVHGQPSADFGGTHRRVMETDRFGNVTASHFFQIDGTPISTEDGHCASFVYHFDGRGFRTGGDCLDGAGKPSRFRQGNAFWRETPDASGYTREGRYFDLNGNPYAIESGFARYELERDSKGRVTERRYFLADGTPGQRNGPAVIRYAFDAQSSEVRRSYFGANGEPTSFKGCASFESEFDSFRQLVRRSCRNTEGKLARGNDGVIVSEWHYDAQGLDTEQRFLDENAHPTTQEDGYARIALQHDALGRRRNTKHFALDGSEIPVGRFAVLIVRVPHSDGFWPGHSREEALSRIETARAELLKGLPWDVALRRYGDTDVSETEPGDLGYMTLKRVYTVVRVALQNLRVGEYSEIVEIPYGFALYLRSE